MRPIIRGDVPKDKNTGKPLIFKEYGEAKLYLIENIGEYCCYCERRINNLLAVEHIKPKEYYPELKLVWENFLLACTNCNSIKGHTKINLTDYFWCDRDNTFLVFTYFNGLVKVNDKLTQKQQEIAQKTIKLIGLDRKPGHLNYSNKDQRWKERYEAWNIAQESLNDLNNQDTEGLRKSIVNTAKAQGFWSIWMTVFRDDKDMLKRFIEAFSGTCQDCFDANFVPVSRQGSAL